MDGKLTLIMELARLAKRLQDCGYKPEFDRVSEWITELRLEVAEMEQTRTEKRA